MLLSFYSNRGRDYIRDLALSIGNAVYERERIALVVGVGLGKVFQSSRAINPIDLFSLYVTVFFFPIKVSGKFAALSFRN